MESFAQLFEESLKEIETRPGSMVKGKIVAIDNDYVIVDAGLKSESTIPAEQFKNAQGEIEVKVGDVVDVALESVESGDGETVLSREKAKRNEAWAKLEEGMKLTGTVKSLTNYGAFVDIVLVNFHAVDNRHLTVCQNSLIAGYRYRYLAVHYPVNFEVAMKMRTVSFGYVFCGDKPRGIIFIDLVQPDFFISCHISTKP